MAKNFSRRLFLKRSAQTAVAASFTPLTIGAEAAAATQVAAQAVRPVIAFSTHVEVFGYLLKHMLGNSLLKILGENNFLINLLDHGSITGLNKFESIFSNPDLKISSAYLHAITELQPIANGLFGDRVITFIFAIHDFREENITKEELQLVIEATGAHGSCNIGLQECSELITSSNEEFSFLKRNILATMRRDRQAAAHFFEDAGLSLDPEKDTSIEELKELHAKFSEKVSGRKELLAYNEKTSCGKFWQDSILQDKAILALDLPGFKF